MIGIELNDLDWDNLLPQIDELLSQSEEFTSPTYSLKGLKSVNDLWVLAKPDRIEWIELLKPLNIDWVKVEIKQNEL